MVLWSFFGSLVFIYLVLWIASTDPAWWHGCVFIFFFCFFATIISASILFWNFRDKNKLYSKQTVSKYVLYILISIWVLHTPNASWNRLFNIHHAQKLKKEKKARNWLQNITIKTFFYLHQNAGRRFYFQQKTFSVVKRCFGYKK